MRQPNFNVMFFIVLILAILIWSGAIANDETPKFTKSNCVIEVIYDENMENEVSRKMICRDGVIGPTYWQLFAQFYYGQDNVPAYCRKVEGGLIPDTVCLTNEGTWEKQ
ncbi:hypothetical protein I899_gp176 [Pelagibacter phage HTVC008M]|jgi:hypothetical protein|uniref:hypothetical protein n=1 Tax=Pelagibacter phage HTVC008M TaxID=1283076 RepID=UPI0002B27C2B|nr:hypothetical protein I899_gp176 [Pelagibacter phage HTVC008M]AGE60510.1 hypothetical protein [Pelagibacter phage HTVC008M]